MLNYVFIRMRKVSRIFLATQLSGDKFFHHESKTGGELWLCFLFSAAPSHQRASHLTNGEEKREFHERISLDRRLPLKTTLYS